MRLPHPVADATINRLHAWDLLHCWQHADVALSDLWEYT